jgi:hypothetical protein
MFMGKTSLRNSMSVVLIVCLLILTARAHAADDRQKKSDERPRRQIALYQLDFSLDETLDGKPSGARNFKLLVQEGETNRVRVGSKIPLPTSGEELKFTDIGLKLDWKLNERDGYIELEGRLELNDLASPTTSPLTIRNFQAEIETAVLLDKATTIGVYDDTVSKRRYELRVTVTKAK